MTAHVDGPVARFGRMVTCIIVAHTNDELHTMADILRVDRLRHQASQLHGSYYHIGSANRQSAVDAGAVLATWRELGCMQMRRRAIGEPGTPNTAEKWLRDSVGRSL